MKGLPHFVAEQRAELRSLMGETRSSHCIPAESGVNCVGSISHHERRGCQSLPGGQQGHPDSVTTLPRGSLAGGM